MEEVVAVDNVFTLSPLMLENAMEEVSTVEANKEEVKIENPFMEETVIWDPCNEDVSKEDNVTLLMVMDDR